MDADRDLEARLLAAGRVLPYPAAPRPVRALALTELSRRPQRAIPVRRLAAAVILFLLIAIIAVPPVRAAVLEFIQVGVIRIFNVEPAPPVPGPTPTPLPALSRVLGRTTLEEASAQVSFQVLLPSLLGEPDDVYFQRTGGALFFLVWLEDGKPEASLTILGPGAFAWKEVREPVVTTLVNGRTAVWVEGWHPFFLQSVNGGDTETHLFLAGTVLIWEQDGITYRLEGEYNLDEAVEIAESLESISE